MIYTSNRTLPGLQRGSSYESNFGNIMLRERSQSQRDESHVIGFSL